jgi:AAA domain
MNPVQPPPGTEHLATMTNTQPKTLPSCARMCQGRPNGRRARTANPTTSRPRRAKNRIRSRNGTPARIELPPPREWLLGNQFCRKFLFGLLAPGATGKSALRLLQFMALATGQPLSGQHVFQRSRVLLVSLEDGRDELRRRIAAARIHHGVDLGIKLAEIKDKARQKGRLETDQDEGRKPQIRYRCAGSFHQASCPGGER